jgi:dCTP deaminase
MVQNGALPDRLIGELVKNGFIRNVRGAPSPASLDVHLGGECYRIKGSFLPKQGEAVFPLAKELGARPYSIDNPLTVGETYLIPLEEEFALPPSIYAFANPKSSTGRNDVHVRIVADGVSRFDALTPSGYSGKAWAIVNPNSYPVLMPPGLAVSQVRFFNRDTRLSELEMELAYTEVNPFVCYPNGDPVAYSKMIANDHDGSLILSIDLESEVAGYAAKRTQEVFDFGSATGSVDWRDFFDEVRVRKGVFEAERDRFYILSTWETLRIPPGYACEAVDLDSRSGDFRSHYAGYIDPGWGYGALGEGRGRTITLEVRSNERRLCFRHGQPLSRFRLERMCEVPDVHYDLLGTSNYRAQSGARLSKHFKTD